jgi:acetaldehyde dehydrogenase (acetylating)
MAAPTDRDLASIQEARQLAQRAKAAAPALAEFSQEQIDRIIDAMAAATRPRAEEFARLAVEETTYGVVADKVQKNLFSSEQVYAFIRPMRTVGVVARDEQRKVIEIAEPFGVVAAIVPSTNPTSTAIYKILISLKARCPIVISPHPSATRCVIRVAEIMAEAARGRCAGRLDQLDDDGYPGRNQRTDEAPGRRGHPGHGRDGSGSCGLQRRETGLRGRTG